MPPSKRKIHQFKPSPREVPPPQKGKAREVPNLEVIGPNGVRKPANREVQKVSNGKNLAGKIDATKRRLGAFVDNAETGGILSDNYRAKRDGPQTPKTAPRPLRKKNETALEYSKRVRKYADKEQRKIRGALQEARPLHKIPTGSFIGLYDPVGPDPLGPYDPRYQRKMRELSRPRPEKSLLKMWYARLNKKNLTQAEAKEARHLDKKRRKLTMWDALQSIVLATGLGVSTPYIVEGADTTVANLERIATDYYNSPNTIDYAAALRAEFLRDKATLQTEVRANEIPSDGSYLSSLYFSSLPTHVDEKTGERMVTVDPVEMLRTFWEAKPDGEAKKIGMDFYLPTYQKALQEHKIASTTLDDYLHHDKYFTPDIPGGRASLSFTEAVTQNLMWSDIERDYRLLPDQADLARRAAKQIDPLTLDAIMMTEVLGGQGTENAQTLNTMLRAGGTDLLAALPSLGDEARSLRSVGGFQVTNLAQREGTGVQILSQKYLLQDAWLDLRLPHGFAQPLPASDFSGKVGIAESPYGTSFQEQKATTTLLAVANIIDMASRPGASTALNEIVSNLETSRAVFEAERKSGTVNPATYDLYKKWLTSFSAIIGLMHHDQDAGYGALRNLAHNPTSSVIGCTPNTGDWNDPDRFIMYAERMTDNTKAIADALYGPDGSKGLKAGKVS